MSLRIRRGTYVPPPPPGQAPVISSFDPLSAQIGGTVVFTGSNFTGSTSVRFFFGINASFTVNSSTQITATVPVGAQTGPVSITNPYGTGVTPVDFTVSLPPTIGIYGPQLSTGTLAERTQFVRDNARIRAIADNWGNRTDVFRFDNRIGTGMTVSNNLGTNILVPSFGGDCAQGIEYMINAAPANSIFVGAKGQTYIFLSSIRSSKNVGQGVQWGKNPTLIFCQDVDAAGHSSTHIQAITDAQAATQYPFVYNTTTDTRPKSIRSEDNSDGVYKGIRFGYSDTYTVGPGTGENNYWIIRGGRWRYFNHGVFAGAGAQGYTIEDVECDSNRVGGAAFHPPWENSQYSGKSKPAYIRHIWCHDNGMHGWDGNYSRRWPSGTANVGNPADTYMHDMVFENCHTGPGDNYLWNTPCCDSAVVGTSPTKANPTRTDHDASGIKMLGVDGMTIRGCWFERQYGPYLWFDGTNWNIIVEDCVLENRSASSMTTTSEQYFFYEMSAGGLHFRRNYVYTSAIPNTYGPATPMVWMSSPQADYTAAANDRNGAHGSIYGPYNRIYSNHIEVATTASTGPVMKTLEIGATRFHPGQKMVKGNQVYDNEFVDRNPFTSLRMLTGLESRLASEQYVFCLKGIGVGNAFTLTTPNGVTAQVSWGSNFPNNLANLRQAVADKMSGGDIYQIWTSNATCPNTSAGSHQGITVSFWGALKGRNYGWPPWTVTAYGGGSFAPDNSHSTADRDGTTDDAYDMALCNNRFGWSPDDQAHPHPNSYHFAAGANARMTWGPVRYWYTGLSFPFNGPPGEPDFTSKTLAEWQKIHPFDSGSVEAVT